VLLKLELSLCLLLFQPLSLAVVFNHFITRLSDL
jgi:hypothetical protein